MKPVVQFDIDGVLADFVKGFVTYGWRELGLSLGKHAASDSNNPTYGTAHVVGPEFNRLIWAAAVKDPLFWESLPPATDRKTFTRIDDIRQRGALYFVTNRMGEKAKRATEHWLEGCGIYRPTVVLTDNKWEFARAVHATHSIEDRPDNAVYIAHESKETQSFLLDRPYNRFDQTVLGTKVRRVSTVGEFLDVVESF